MPVLQVQVKHQVHQELAELMVQLVQQVMPEIVVLVAHQVLVVHQVQLVLQD